MQDKLTAIRAVVISAVPEIVEELGMNPDAGDVYTEERPITLADVLRATEDKWRQYKAENDLAVIKEFLRTEIESAEQRGRDGAVDHALKIMAPYDGHSMARSREEIRAWAEAARSPEKESNL